MTTKVPNELLEIGVLADATNFTDSILISQNASTGTLSSASNNTGLGDSVFAALTSGTSNTAIGKSALAANTTATNNVAIGVNALDANTTGNYLVAIGNNTYTDFSGNDWGVAVGHGAMKSATTAGNCTAVGPQALEDCTSGHNNTAVGMNASRNVTTGQSNTSVGVDALEDTTEGQFNSVLGSNAGANITTGDNNSCIGYQAGKAGSPGGTLTTADNRIVLGNGNIATLSCEVSISGQSDERDKTDFTNLDIGLDFVKQMKPYTYKWDKRHKYVDWDKNPDTDLNSITHDGTHKVDYLDIGFKAQEIEALEVAAGYKKEDKTNLVVALSDDGTSYSLKYERMIPILVKAIQEADAKIEALTTRITTLEG